MRKAVLALLLVAGPAFAADISVSCQITKEVRTTSSGGKLVGFTSLNPLTVETFTITDDGIKGFPRSDITSDHANGFDEKGATKTSVFIDRKTGSLMKVVEVTERGLSMKWASDGTCKKVEGF